MNMSDTLKVNNSTVRLVQADITELDVDAFVFYADHNLQLGSGFGTAVALRGGPSIQEELKEHGPAETTEVVVSKAGKLNAEHILHAVGPRFQEEDLEAKLRTTVLNCLTAAERNGIKKVAFPAMGVGFYGVPLATSASVTLTAARDYLSNNTGIENVIVCLLDSREFKPFSAQLAAMAAARAKV
jgi:O-acetyl-ADP-ribose deacetylase (regulator of RNase III)